MKNWLLTQWEKITSEIATHFFKPSNSHSLGKGRGKKVGRGGEGGKEGEGERRRGGREGEGDKEEKGKGKERKRRQSSFWAWFTDLFIDLDFAALENELTALHGPGKCCPTKLCTQVRSLINAHPFSSLLSEAA